MNVAEGGSMHQHIPDLLKNHDHEGGNLQEYSVEPGSKSAEMMGVTSAKGKSYHHQSIDELGQGIKVVGKCEDGIVEVIESTERPWMIGLQWHPERTPDEPSSKNIFKNFIIAARAFHEQKQGNLVK